MSVLFNMSSAALLVAVMVYFAIGGVWFFSTLGRRLAVLSDVKIGGAEKKEVGKMFTMTFLTNMVIFFATAYMVSLVRPMDMAATLRLGLSLAVGFMAAPSAMNYLDARKPIKLTMLDAGYHMVGIIVITLILSMWK